MAKIKDISLLLGLLLLNGCAPPLQKYTDTILGPFDTVTTFIAYAQDEETFNSYRDAVFSTLEEMHVLFDIYNEYDGVNNLYTINKQAGIEPVVVDAEIITLLEHGIESHRLTEGAFNIALGSVLQIWHDHRTYGIAHPEDATVPERAVLTEANHHTDINKLVIDKVKHTVYLEDKDMSLDVGAIGKGYAAELAMARAKALGMENGLISAGGHIVAVGKPAEENRDAWHVAIQDPTRSQLFQMGAIDTISASDVSVSMSGPYQRYFEVDGVIFGHLIHPQTLMPSVLYDQVVIIHPSSWMTDILSTALFNLSIEEGKLLAQEVGAQVLWIDTQGHWTYTDGYKEGSNVLNQ